MQHPGPGVSDQMRFGLTLAFGAAGAALNLINVPLFFGVDFLFGSALALAPALVFGWFPGLVATAIAALPTLLHWHHPYAIITFGLEGLMLGWLVQRRRERVVEADLAYWALIAAPVTAVIYYFVLGLPPGSVLTLVAKQSLNGVVNAVLCSAWLMFADIDRRLDRRSARDWPLRSYLVHVLTLFLIAPVLLSTIWFGNWFFRRVNAEASARASALGVSLTQRLQAWSQEHLAAVETIAGAAGPDMDRPERLQQYLQLFHPAFPDFHNLYIADSGATTLAFEPEVNAAGESTLGLNFADRPYFDQARAAMRPFMTSAFVGRGGTTEPITVAVAPIRDPAHRFIGFATGATNLAKLRVDIIEPGLIGGGDVVVVDQLGQVVLSTSPQWQTLSQWQPATIGSLNPGDGAVTRILATASTTVGSWQQGRFAWRGTEPASQWEVIALISLAPYAAQLFQTYTVLMGIALLFILLAVGVSQRFARTFTAPLERLADAAGAPTCAAGASRWLAAGRIAEVNTLSERLQTTLTRMEAEAETAQRVAAELRRTLDASIDMIVTISVDGTVRTVNAACTAVLGYPAAAMPGQPVTDFIHADDWERATKALADVQAELVRSVQLRMLTRDGRTVWAEWNCQYVPAERFVYCVGRDMTERRRSEAALRFLADVSVLLTSARDNAASLAAVAQLAAERLADWCVIATINPDATIHTLAVGHADPARAEWGRQVLEHCRVQPEGERRFAALLMAAQLTILDGDGVESLSAWLGGLSAPEVEAAAAPKSMVIAPLAVGGQTMGAICLLSQQPDRRFGAEDLAVAQDLAHRTVLAMENSRLYGELERAAFDDSLTGLPNRFLFLERLAHALARTRRQRSGVAVLFLDLDNFKNVNDSLGHAAGDEVLVTVARRLRQSVRATDTAARLGGDEFMVLLEDLESVSGAVEVAERIHAALRAPCLVSGHEFFLAASIGITYSTTGEEDPEGLMRDVDIAMYQAKNSGKGQSVIFDREMRGEAEQRLSLETSLRRAAERQEWCLHYQPIVDLETRRIAGLEALLRWEHPTRGLVAPAEFIPTLEDTGLIVPVGEWVLAEACRQFTLLQRQHAATSPLFISVNVSPRQLQAEGFVESVATIIGRSGVSPGDVCLEITEGVLAKHDAVTTSALHGLRGLGVRLVLDDFGVGYSSLSYFRHFPLEALKIDGSFVRGLGASPADTAIVTAVTEFAAQLHLEVVGEGVETADQMDQLRRLGVRWGQGYYFARPLPADEVAGLLARAVV